MIACICTLLVVGSIKFLFSFLFRKNLQLEFLDHGVLTLLKNWLEPLPDGSLPNMNIRTAILTVLTDVSILNINVFFHNIRLYN